ncbi:MAG: hypothetical protein ABJO67_09885 [Pseudoruegeria sp.]
MHRIPLIICATVLIPGCWEAPNLPQTPKYEAATEVTPDLVPLSNLNMSASDITTGDDTAASLTARANQLQQRAAALNNTQ